MTLYDRAALAAAFDRGERPELLLFWGHTPSRGEPMGRWVLSQWWPCRFVVDGRTYTSAEHWMMAEKARLFGDDEFRERILRADTPADAKRLGRQVRAFDDDVWKAHRVGIVRQGSLEKFGQDAALRSFLLATGDKVLVEASPRDRIWGIGLGASNPAAQDPRTWRGENLLGFALMWARDRLRLG